MKTVKICLNSIEKVKSFVNDITKFDVDFDLVSGRYVIDAKSIMGIFSLDLSKPIDLSIHADEELDSILNILKPYLIEEYFTKLFTLHKNQPGVAGLILFLFPFATPFSIQSCRGFFKVYSSFLTFRSISSADTP